MQIVIDIPEVQYEYLLKIIDAGEEPVGYYERVIMRGTPLPKGHGKLGDLDELEVLMKDEILNHDLNEYGCLDLIKRKRTSVIIEADEEDEE